MDECGMCGREVEPAQNWIKCYLYGGWAVFHWHCLGQYLGADGEERVYNAVWKAQSRK
jgi:hypothetical protein